MTPHRKLVAASVVGMLLLAIALGGMGGEVVRRLIFGWAWFVGRVVPGVRVSGEGIFLGVLCLVLFTGGLHLFLRWIHSEITRQRTGSAEIQGRWSPRWTACIVGVLLLMFVAGIAATGIAHQAGWLVRGRGEFTAARLEQGEYRGQDDAVNRMKTVGLGVANHVSTHDFLPGSVRDKQGRFLHSWLTQLLPDMAVSVGGQVDYDRPWNDPVNSAYFKSVVPIFLNPEVGELRSAEGYALSHFAGNARFLGSPRKLTMRDLTAGSSNTILGGEIPGAFQPWGEPTNLRDPGLGINQHINGFGGPSGDGANMLFFDGSVRFLPKGTQSEILRHSAGPEAAKSAGVGHE